MRLPKTKGIKKEKPLGNSGGSGKEFNTDSIWGIVGIVLLILVVLFILMGGINQLQLVKTLINIGETISRKVGEFLQQFNLSVTDNGVYLQP